MNLFKMLYDKQFSCDYCDYKSHRQSHLNAHCRETHSDESKIPKKRRKLQTETPPDDDIVEDNSQKIEDVVKIEKPEDHEEIEPFDEIPISNLVKTEPETASEPKPKFSLKGLLNKSSIKLVTSIKVFKCAICKQEGIESQYLCRISDVTQILNPVKEFYKQSRVSIA